MPWSVMQLGWMPASMSSRSSVSPWCIDGAHVDRAVVVDRRAARGAIGHVPQGLDFDVGFEDLDNLGRSRSGRGVDAKLDHEMPVRMWPGAGPQCGSSEQSRSCSDFTLE